MVGTFPLAGAYRDAANGFSVGSLAGRFRKCGSGTKSLELLSPEIHDQSYANGNDDWVCHRHELVNPFQNRTGWLHFGLLYQVASLLVVIVAVILASVSEVARILSAMEQGDTHAGGRKRSKRGEGIPKE